MFPYHDENETQRPAYVTMALVAINVLVWILVQGAGSSLPLATSVCNLGLIPGELTGALPPGAGFPMGDGLVCLIDPGRQPINVLTSMFLHGSWMHLLGNMWFLWLFGNNIEDAMSRTRFLAFYLLCGLAAALLQVFVEPDSAIPMVGASGAISGVMGAYLVLFPRSACSRSCRSGSSSRRLRCRRGRCSSTGWCCNWRAASSRSGASPEAGWRSGHTSAGSSPAWSS